MNIPHFRGVFSKDKLPSSSWEKEALIVNLDNDDGPGTHWVALRKNGLQVKYYDSYGNLKPPLEIIKYLKNCIIFYNYVRDQNYNTEICGHLCLKFLSEYM